MLIQIAGKDQLIGLGLFNQHLQLGADFLRAANHGQAEETAHCLFLMGQPKPVHGAHRRSLHQALPAHQRQYALIHRCRQVVGAFVGVCCNQRYTQHHIRLVEDSRGLEVIAIHANGLMHVARRKVRSERVWQATLACQLCAEQA
ncbi:hypothetical protein D3C76_1393200 [compost metagenome]